MTREASKKDSSADMVINITKHLSETIEAYKKEIKPNAVFALFGKQRAVGHGDAQAKIDAATELLNVAKSAVSDDEKLAKLLGGIKFFIDQGGFFGDTLAEKLVAKHNSVSSVKDSFSENRKKYETFKRQTSKNIFNDKRLNR